LAIPLPGNAAGPVLGPAILQVRNLRLHGQLEDYTNHHGADRRIWSDALQERRSLYVYLPPGFDPCRQYPLVLWLHGIIEDERTAADRALLYFDRAIADGRLPPLIVVMPNGRYHPCHPCDKSYRQEEPRGASRWSRWDRGFPFDSHFLNTRAGRFEDYLLDDVLPFVEAHYPVRPEREAHVIMGFSLSGWSAYAVALKHTHRFGVVIGILPPLNMRWVDCHGAYQSHFDPCCWGWRTELDHNEIIARWNGIDATLKRAVEPYFGWGPEGLAWLSRENPIELLDLYHIQPCEIAMYVAYIKNDEFNVTAQVESYLYAAHQRGLCVAVDYDPVARSHTLRKAMDFIPASLDWLAVQLAPYSP
jgi:predicted alpha/beta superfamily hydrolase